MIEKLALLPVRETTEIQMARLKALLTNQPLFSVPKIKTLFNRIVVRNFMFWTFTRVTIRTQLSSANELAGQLTNCATD